MGVLRQIVAKNSGFINGPFSTNLDGITKKLLAAYALPSGAMGPNGDVHIYINTEHSDNGCTRKRDVTFDGVSIVSSSL